MTPGLAFGMAFVCFYLAGVVTIIGLVERRLKGTAR